MKNILVATDFSAVALNAVHFAHKLAQTIDANLILLNTYQIPISYTEVPLVTISIDEIRRTSVDGLRELKENLDKIGSKKINIICISRLGDVAEEIVSVNKEYKVILIVTGTKGISGIERFIIGSNTLRIIEKNKEAVISVPPGCAFTKVKNIGLATDFIHVQETTDANRIKFFTELFNANLYVINVDHNKKHFTSDTPEETIKFDSLLNPVKPYYSYIDNIDVIDGINTFIADKNIDILIMMPRVHTLIEKILEKSHSREMIKYTRVPILHLMKKN